MPASVKPGSHFGTKSRLDALRLQLMASEMAEQIGRRIRERREELRLNQRELAERLNDPVLTNQRISDWERGVNKPSERYMHALARALERDVAWFYGGEKGPTPDLMAGNGNSSEREERLERIEAELAAVRGLLQALATRLEADVPPPPPGEVGRRLQAVSPNEEDQALPESPEAEDSR